MSVGNIGLYMTVDMLEGKAFQLLLLSMETFT